jgi:hypothetical protein
VSVLGKKDCLSVSALCKYADMFHDKRVTVCAERRPCNHPSGPQIFDFQPAAITFSDLLGWERLPSQLVLFIAKRYQAVGRGTALGGLDCGLAMA